MIRKLHDLGLSGKRVFVRVDFNVPVERERIMETHRIDATLPTLRHVLGKAGTAVIASHLGRPGGKRDAQFSLAPIREYLAQALGQPVTLAPDCVGPRVESLVNDPGHKTVLLENLRFHKEEEKNDSEFSRALAALADVYVNDAFGAAHRAHASTAGMVRFCAQKGAGLLLQKELEYLGRALSQPEKPFVAILGGAKVSDKIGVIRKLLPKVDALLIGGGMAYTFLRAKEIATGKSLVEEDRIPLARQLLAEAANLGKPIFLPVDHRCATESLDDPTLAERSVPADRVGLDIGPKTVARFCEEIRKARMVLWNGPVGRFEVEPFGEGTRALAACLAAASVVSIVGGGETVAAIRQAGLEDKITHLSTGGGATLEFLEGKSLPGIDALEEPG
jgi:phosphoglycerate kinase